VSAVNPRVIKVLDLKPPGSGEEAANRYENLAYLQPADQVKFVIRDELDYRWASEKLKEHRLPERCEVLFSPVAGEQDPTALAERILADRLDVRFQMQLHKHLWGDRTGV
jgi:7-carboxy-7-deazaguanine synthase